MEGVMKGALNISLVVAILCIGKLNNGVCYQQITLSLEITS